MCGNFSQIQEERELLKRFGLKELPSGLILSDSIYPGQKALILFQEEGDLTTETPLWGLIPFWVKNSEMAKKISRNTFNARSETIDEKPSFRTPLKRSRCIVPASNFYEFIGEKGHKTKVELKLNDEGFFSFAGLRDTWVDKSTGKELHTFTIITCEANELVAKYHPKNRMPVIFTTKEKENLWLDPKSDIKTLKGLLQTLPSIAMRASDAA